MSALNRLVCVLRKVNRGLIVLSLAFSVLGASTGFASAEYYIPLPVNINRADELTLSRVMSGVGPKKAAAIVEYRQLNGDFQSVEDLKAVKGIGRGTLEKNRGRIMVE